MNHDGNGLLADIRDVLAAKVGRPKKALYQNNEHNDFVQEISSADLVKALVALEGRPWAAIGDGQYPTGCQAQVVREAPFPSKQNEGYP